MSLSLPDNDPTTDDLVETLTAEEPTLTDANLSTLSSNDFEQLAQLSDELQFTTEMDTTGLEEELMDTQEEVQSEVVQPEIGAHEVEIETECTQAPEENIPDVKTKSTIPPLRPLTIAPKPTKLPITLKSAGGQQLLLLQGGTGGQPIKLVNPQGQGISVTNLSHITLRPAGKNISANTMSVLQPKQVILKKIAQPQKVMGDTKNFVLTNKLDVPAKSTQGTVTLPTPPKTITLAQAQQIGLLTGAKFVPQATAKQAIVLNKTPNKTIKIVPQGSRKDTVLTNKLEVPVKSTQSTFALPTLPKTITLAQAQKIGLLSGAKFVPQVAAKPAIVLNKTPNKTIKIAPQESRKDTVLSNKLEVPVKSTQGAVVLSTPPKTITLAQAQQIGLLSGAKFVPRVPAKQSSVLNKTPNKTIKIAPQTKPHTKILPAPQTSSGNKLGQRIILKHPNTTNTMMAPGQIIQVTGTQPLLSGQLHQINIPGKGVQYIKIVTPPAIPESGSPTSSTSNIVARPTFQTPTVETKIPVLSAATTSAAAAKATNVVLTEAPVGAANIAPKLIKTTTVTRSNTVHLPTSGQLVMLPANYLPQQAAASAKVAIPAKSASSKASVSDSATSMADMNLESNGMRPRKPCNCTKSQCLKLYCDCFANGEFCYLCNCMNCSNNLENEEHRQRAIKSCLERNPSAFRPKIGKAKDTGDSAIRKHTKGCNCKRSGCLKNYCECYEAKIACSSNCKCLGCRNIEDSMDKKSAIAQANLHASIPVSPPLASKLGGPRNLLQFRPRRNSNTKYAFSFITDEVIEATSQCLLTLCDNAETNGQDEEVTKLQVIEEFGRCLKEIIDCSATHTASNAPT